MALRRISVPWTQQPQEAAVLDPRWGLRPEICWIASNPTLMGPRGVGTLTGMHAGIAGPGLVITGDGTNGNGVTINGGDKTARDAATFVVVCRRSVTGLQYHGLIGLTGQSGSNAGVYVSDNGSGKGLAIVKGGVAAMAEVDALPTNQWIAVVASWRQSDGLSYIVAAPLGEPASWRNTAVHGAGMIGGNGTYCVGRVRGDIPSWPGDIALAIASFDWLPEVSADELLANPWSLFEPRRIWVPVSVGGGTTVNAGIGAATATGLQADISLGTTVSAGVGESTAAGSTADISLGTTINAGVGSAVADGSAASVSRGATVNASIGAAVAAGLDADISTSAGEYQVGNAVADGATASISLGTTVSANVSNAVAAGSTADVSLGTTVAAGVGNAVADGLSATITAGQTVSATVGDAVADGKTATITNDPVSTGIDLSFYGWDIFPEEVPKEKDNLRKYILDAVRDLSPKPLQREVAKRATARILPPPVFVPRNLMVREIRLAVAEIVEAANEERRRKVRKYNETIMLWM